MGTNVSSVITQIRKTHWRSWKEMGTLRFHLKVALRSLAEPSPVLGIFKASSARAAGKTFRGKLLTPSPVTRVVKEKATT